MQILAKISMSSTWHPEANPADPTRREYSASVKFVLRQSLLHLGVVKLGPAKDIPLVALESSGQHEHLEISSVPLPCQQRSLGHLQHWGASATSLESRLVVLLHVEQRCWAWAFPYTWFSLLFMPRRIVKYFAKQLTYYPYALALAESAQLTGNSSVEIEQPWARSCQLIQTRPGAIMATLSNFQPLRDSGWSWIFWNW